MNILCPLCSLPLSQADKHWHCESNHHFDSAKQGYTNLLLVQNKRSKIPGDDANMVNARKRFLSQAYYQPLALAINQLALQQLNHKSQANIIDAGCGEGYYTQALHASLTNQGIAADTMGIDISKFAVKAAASQHKTIQWFVASSSHLPVAPHTCDILLSLFSPLPEPEFHRTLNSEGTLIVASTGPQHLIEMREILYDKIDYSSLDPCAKLTELFEPVTSSNLQFKIELNSSETISDLLSMTPHYWRATLEKKQQLTELKQLTVTIDINLYSLRPNSL